MIIKAKVDNSSNLHFQKQSTKISPYKFMQTKSMHKSGISQTNILKTGRNGGTNKHEG